MEILEKRGMYANKIEEINRSIKTSVDAYLTKLYTEAAAKAEIYRAELQEKAKADIEKCQRYISVLDEMLADEGMAAQVEQPKVEQPQVVEEKPVVEPQVQEVDLAKELHQATEAFDHASQRPGMTSIEFPKR